MKRFKARIKMPFGELVLEGDEPKELLDMLETFPDNFNEKIANLISNKLIPSKAQIKGIIEFTTEGPVIVTREKLTHYEAIGLLLYVSEEKSNTATKLTKLLRSSGLKCMVPARVNEMTKRGQIFKPNPNKPKFKLTILGERWIENEVFTRLKRSH